LSKTPIKIQMKEPFLILLIIFVLLGLAYGPIKENSSNNTGNISGSSSVGKTSSSDSASNKELSEDIQDTKEEIKKIEENLNKKAEESKRSPFYNKISLSSIYGLYGDDPNQEYISIYTDLDKNESINITGWYLKSETTGYYALVDKASLLPFPFAKTESNVVLNRGDRVYLIKGFSPIGISFRTNKCTGYFEENRTFSPNLSLQCPLAIDENLPKFSSVYDRNDECLDLIENVSRCTTRDSRFTRDLPDTVLSTCKEYLTTQINYNSCVANHFDDTDFPGNEYYIYLNKFGPLWREKREKINLYDQNNLVVDTIEY